MFKPFQWKSSQSPDAWTVHLGEVWMAHWVASYIPLAWPSNVRWNYKFEWMKQYFPDSRLCLTAYGEYEPINVKLKFEASPPPRMTWPATTRGGYRIFQPAGQSPTWSLHPESVNEWSVQLGGEPLRCESLDQMIDHIAHCDSYWSCSSGPLWIAALMGKECHLILPEGFYSPDWFYQLGLRWTSSYNLQLHYDSRKSGLWCAHPEFEGQSV
jgi:hypothetical protein